jgi:hypothetical protein
MNYQDAIERAIALRLRAKKETDAERKQALLDLAQRWEVWAEMCREQAAQGGVRDPAARPEDDIE